MKRFMEKAKKKFTSVALKTNYLITDQRGEAFVEVAVRILIIIVLGALLLAGLYALFGDVVLPTLEQRIQDMFDFAG